MRRTTSKPYPYVERLLKGSIDSFATADHLNRSYANYDRRYAFPKSRDPEEWKKWRRNLRRALRKTLTLEKLGDPPSPSHEVLSETDCGVYVRQKIAYESLPGYRVSAYLLIPQATDNQWKRGAVICPHGHVPSAKENVVGLTDPVGVAYGHELARRGLYVLAPDNAGMGERDVDQDRKLANSQGCFLAFARLNQMGLDLTGLRIFDLMVGLNLLTGLPDVDRKRIGCAGLSGGCWLSQVLTALDRRISAVILSGFFTTFVQTVWHGHCICHHPFGIGLVCDMPDISALIAPRPQFVESGISDGRYPHEPAYSLVQEAYHQVGASNALNLHRYRGSHMFNGKLSIPWLVHQLSTVSTKF